MGPRSYTLFASFCVILIFAGLNIAGQRWLAPVRADLTDAGLYTLSEAAEDIASQLTEPVDLEFVYSRAQSADYPAVRAYGARVRELLNEISARSGGNVRIAETDPAPFTVDEDRVLEAGLTAAPSESGDPLYFGVIGRNSVDDQLVIPFLSPEREALLEYDLVKLISQLDDPAPPRIGLITDLRTFSGDGTAKGDPYILREIARSFKIEQVPNNFVVVPENLDALLIVHPPELSLRQQYAIDQFLLSNGRALIALDPASRSALTRRGRRARLSSKLGRAEATLGLAPLDEVVIDRELGLPVERVEDGRRVVESQPLFVAPSPNLLSREDPVTADISRPINFGAPGRLIVSPPSGARFQALIRTSDDAALISPQLGGSDVSPRDLLTEYASMGEAQVLMGRLSGQLASAFSADDIPPIQLPDDPVLARLVDVPDELPEHLVQSARPADILLVSDADLFDDSFFVAPGGAPIADNAVLILNALDNIAGDAALVRLRSRAPSLRSMTRIDAMRDAAREALYVEQSNLENRLTETEARMTELRMQGVGGGFLRDESAIDAAQAEELAQFRSEAIEIRQRLRDVEREFRAEIDALERRLVVFNMWLPPLVIILLGVFIMTWRSRRKGARRS